MSKDRDFESLEEAVPACDSGVIPLGARILLQLKSVKKASKGGILLVKETRETESAQSMIAKVIAVGPLAFKNRETAAEWSEGVWCKEGDYCRVPRWSGDRFVVPHPTDSEDEISFQVMNDFELFARVDPEKVLNMRQFV
jgi:co-chaperonin GroES (HSP10)